MKNYNDKEFLLPDSPDSCASYHAKTEGDNDSYKLTISDCNRSIRLWGSLASYQDCLAALDKLRCLQAGIDGLCNHIIDNVMTQVEK